MKPRVIKDEFGDTATVSSACGEIEVNCAFTHSSNVRYFVFTREQSRELRKALKRAERA